MELIASIKKDDKAAFRQAFDEWHARVYQYHLLKTRNPFLAEEFTQLTFIKLWEFRHGLSDEYDFSVQLFRIARTTLIDQLRSRSRQLKKEQLLEQEKKRQVAVQHPQYEPDMHRVLETLPPVRKQVFVLSRLHGLSHKQIGNVLSISDRTVEKHISLAIKQLKKLLLNCW